LPLLCRPRTAVSLCRCRTARAVLIIAVWDGCPSHSAGPSCSPPQPWWRNTSSVELAYYASKQGLFRPSGAEAAEHAILVLDDLPSQLLQRALSRYSRGLHQVLETRTPEGATMPCVLVRYQLPQCHATPPVCAIGFHPPIFSRTRSPLIIILAPNSSIIFG